MKQYSVFGRIVLAMHCSCLFIYLFTLPSYLYIHWLGNHNSYCQLQRPPVRYGMLVYASKCVIADAASEPETSEQVSSSNSCWALKVGFYFRFSHQNAFWSVNSSAFWWRNGSKINRPECFACMML